VDVLNAIGFRQTPFTLPAWMPKIEFTWYAMVGGLVTLVVGLLFRTPEEVLVAAEIKAGLRTAATAASPLSAEPAHTGYPTGQENR
jgi:hypothetical protein